MKTLRKKCLDCGSEAVETVVDEIKPSFRMEVIRYACGAELMNASSSVSGMGRISHSGCTH